MSSETIYAKVTNGVITEFPVKESYIVARGQSIAAYTPCVFDPLPLVPEFYTLAQDATLNGDVVKVTYRLVAMSLDQVLRRLPNSDKYVRMMIIPVEPQSTYAGTMPSTDLFEKIMALTRDRIQANLDAFAQTRKYDNIASAISYENSVVPKYHDEGTFCHELRDRSWAALEIYTQKVLTSTVPLPYRWDLIEQNLPPMVWPETLSTALS